MDSETMVLLQKIGLPLDIIKYEIDQYVINAYKQEHQKICKNILSELIKWTKNLRYNLDNNTTLWHEDDLRMGRDVSHYNPANRRIFAHKWYKNGYENDYVGSITWDLLESNWYDWYYNSYIPQMKKSVGIFKIFGNVIKRMWTKLLSHNLWK